MTSKLVWDGQSRKGDAVIEDSKPFGDSLILSPYNYSPPKGDTATLIEISRGSDEDTIIIDKSDATELVKYLNAIIPTMK